MPDWFPAIAKHLLTGILLVVVIQKMVRNPPVASPSGNGMVLHYSRWFSGMGGVIFVIFFGVGIYSFRQPPPGWLAMEVLSILFSLLGLFIFLYGFYTKVEVENTKITSHVFWRSPITLHWIEVEKVDFTGSKQFRIHTFGGEKIYVDMLIGGLSTLLAGFSKNLSVDKYLDAVRAYWKTSKNYQQSFGSILAVPPIGLAKISAQIGEEDMGALLQKITHHIEEGLGEKEIEGILKKIKKANPNQGIDMEFEVLFKGMPVRLFLFIFFGGHGRRDLDFFAPFKLAEVIKVELEKSGAKEVTLELDEDET